MSRHKLARQTALLSGTHFIVRLMGFVLRIWLSRELGAQAMGLVELAQSAQMLLISPVVSGLPAAVSRLSAQRSRGGALRVARCGVRLSLLFSLPLMLAAFLLREPLARWMGDIRTLPALLCFLPCIPLLGVSCALNGYFYGTDRPLPPALSELVEQAVRVLLCLRLVPMMRTWPTTLRAAIPAAATLAGETAGLVLMLAALLLCVLRRARIDIPGAQKPGVYRALLSLALPLTGVRLVSSLMHTVNAALIPARLQVSGLAAQEALSRFGMLHGMALPVLLAPSFITGSLSMVTAPELARRQAGGKPLRALVRRVLLSTLCIGLPAMAAVWLLAPVVAGTLYRQAELLPLLRLTCPLVPVMALAQVCAGLMNGLGLQRKSLRISLAANLTALLTTYVLAAQPALRLTGAAIGMAAGHLVSMTLSLRALRRGASDAELTPPECNAG